MQFLCGSKLLSHQSQQWSRTHGPFHILASSGMWNGDPVGAPVIGYKLYLGNMEAAEVQSGEFLSLASDLCAGCRPGGWDCQFFQ